MSISFGPLASWKGEFFGLSPLQLLFPRASAARSMRRKVKKTHALQCFNHPHFNCWGILSTHLSLQCGELNLVDFPNLFPKPFGVEVVHTAWSPANSDSCCSRFTWMKSWEKNYYQLNVMMVNIYNKKCKCPSLSIPAAFAQKVTTVLLPPHHHLRLVLHFGESLPPAPR